MNKKKGFTLIELLAVIIIIGIISLIITAVSINLIFKAKKNHFRNEVLVSFNTLEEYLTANGEDKLNQEGITVNDLKTIKSNNFIDGLYLKVGGTEEAYYVTDGKFCARGPKENIRVEDACYKLDDTPAVVDQTKIHLVNTENTITVTLDSNYASDTESGISRVEITVTGGGITKKIIVDTLGSHVIDKLKHNTDYEVTVKVINGNEIPATLTYNIHTDDISIPQITLDTEEWSQSKTATIDYPAKTGYINEYSLDDGKTWHTYTDPIVFNENGSIIARTSDPTRTNVVSSESLTVDLIDTTNPTCGAWSGEATSSTDWAQSRTVEVACQDDGECAEEAYGETINTGVTTTKDLEFEIYDKAGNHTTCSKEGAMFYVDKQAPSCNGWSGENGSWKNSGTVTVNVGCTDGSGSGCVQNSYQAYTVSSGNISTKSVSVNIYDKAGNYTNCSKTANIYLDTSTYTATFNGNGGGNGTSKTSKFGVALGTLPSSSRTCYSFGGWYTAASGGSKIGTGTTMPRGGATYYAHWSTSNGWSGLSYFCSGGSKVTSRYMQTNTGLYLWINSSGNVADSSKPYAWEKSSGKWWFHLAGSTGTYERNCTRKICKVSGTTQTCKDYAFDSSGWCSTDNYACN